MTARSQMPIGHVQRVDDREVERRPSSACTTTAPREAAAERAGLLAEAGERRGERLDAVADPFGMQDASAAAAAVRSRPAPAPPAPRRPAPTQKPAHSHDGQIGSTRRGRAVPPPAIAPSAATRTSAHQAEHRDRPGRPWSRASSTAPRGAVSRMRMTSPPMLLGRKLLKKLRDEERAEQPCGTARHVLRARAADASATTLASDVQRVDARAPRPATAIEAWRAIAQRRRDVDPREQEREQGDADDDLERQQCDSVAARMRRGLCVGHSKRTGTVTVLRFRAKITRSVRILMIAPEPFFEPRGTPFSEFHRIRALTDARPHGRSRHVSVRPATSTMPGLRVFRCLRPPFVRGVGHRAVAGEGAARRRC